MPRLFNPRYRDAKWQELTARKKAEAGYTCRDCGKTTYSHWLVTHHVNKNPFDDADDNLVVLCGNCHDMRHYGKVSIKYNLRNLTPKWKARLGRRV